jgi:acetoin utilization deacetylase AcuC-like enzyme
VTTTFPFFYSEAHRLHAPAYMLSRGAEAPALETPDRADALASALSAAGSGLIAPRDFGIGPIARIHSPDYLEFLETAYERWQELRTRTELPMSPIVQAGALALGYIHRPPRTLIAQAPHYLGGGYAPIDAGTYTAAVASAHVALEGAQALLEGQRLAYSLCRPPGHHAYAAMAGGFCYFNNIAIAAQHLVERLGCVSVLDIDVHHGNGTQALFYERDDVMTVSVHVDPTHTSPFCCGYADETGAGRGRGWNVNLPLPVGSGDAAYLDGVERGAARINATGSSALLVALGFDAYAGDPTAAMSVTTDGFRAAGEAIGKLGLPTLLVQEGGYAVEALGRNVQAFLGGFLQRAS